MTAASPQLLRVLLRQNEEMLRRAAKSPPADIDSASGRQHVEHVGILRQQTDALRARLEPRRCQTDIVANNGDCLACGAIMGEACRKP